MATELFFENKKFLVIPDDDEKYIIYVLPDFSLSNFVVFKADDNDRFFLKIGTVKLPCNSYGYGYESNFLHCENKIISGGLLNCYKTETEALYDLCNYINKYGTHRCFYGKEIIEKLNNYINPKSLF